MIVEKPCNLNDIAGWLLNFGTLNWLLVLFTIIIIVISCCLMPAIELTDVAFCTCRYGTATNYQGYQQLLTSIHHHYPSQHHCGPFDPH